MELRHRIPIGRYTAGENEWGDPAPAKWVNTATVWAAVEGLGGRLYFEAQQTDQQSDHRIAIRYRAGIEPALVVKHDGRP
ncbi:MAG TPA: head-tail adaptor protein, partial [Firmicutes bacterium]|nr:head-tail adaptor protein [Bacillota bacterium]